MNTRNNEIDKDESNIIDNGYNNLYEPIGVADILMQFCNFSTNGELILFCKVSGYDDGNLIFIYSIQAKTKTKKCQNLYMAPKEAEVIRITEYDNVWLRIGDHIHEWNLRDGCTTLVLDNIPDVSYKFIILTFR